MQGDYTYISADFKIQKIRFAACRYVNFSPSYSILKIISAHVTCLRNYNEQPVSW